MSPPGEARYNPSYGWIEDQVSNPHSEVFSGCLPRIGYILFLRIYFQMFIEDYFAHGRPFYRTKSVLADLPCLWPYSTVCHKPGIVPHSFPAFQYLLHFLDLLPVSAPGESLLSGERTNGHRHPDVRTICAEPVFLCIIHDYMLGGGDSERSWKSQKIERTNKGQYLIILSIEILDLFHCSPFFDLILEPWLT